MDEKLKALLTENMASKQAEADAIKKEFTKLYNGHYDAIEKEINDFAVRYAKGSRMPRTEVMKLVSEMDVVNFAEKAKQYVADAQELRKKLGRPLKYSDFSDEENEELAIYNMKMKMNRLQMLRGNMDLAMFDLLKDEMDLAEKLINKEIADEVILQAGILGESVKTPNMILDAVRSTLNTPIEDELWSHRIWKNHSELKHVVDREVAMWILRGRNPDELAGKLKKRFNTSSYKAARLAVTECAKAQIGVQRENYKRLGIEWYEILTEPKACEVCIEISKKGPFKVAEMKIGENAPAMHPWCRCTTYASTKGLTEKMEDAISDYKKLEKNLKGFKNIKGNRGWINE